MTYVVMRALTGLAAALVLGRRLRVEGVEHVPRRGPALVVGNHVGAVDPVLFAIHAPRRDVYFMGKSELFRGRLSAWMFRHCHTFPVVRNSPDRTALRRALDVLAAGHVLVLYPEGTRGADGREAEPHAGAGFIARRAGVPIVPVACSGSDRVLPRGAWLPRRADVLLRIGAPFRLQEAGAGGGRLSSRDAVDLMMARIRGLLPDRATAPPPRAA